MPISALESNNDNRCEISSENISLPKSEQTTSIVTSSAIQSTNSRPSCSYGASCYRKNPQHKVDAAHPGDNDYKGVRVDRIVNFRINDISLKKTPDQ